MTMSLCCASAAVPAPPSIAQAKGEQQRLAVDERVTKGRAGERGTRMHPTPVGGGGQVELQM